MTPEERMQESWDRQAEAKQKAAVMTPEQKQAESKADAERMQDSYTRQAEAWASSPSNSCPAIPAPEQTMGLTQSARRDWMSLEVGRERAVLAATLPDLRAAAEVAESKSKRVTDELTKTQAELAKAEARIGTKADDVDARLALAQKVKALAEDSYRLASQAGVAMGQVRTVEGKLRDGLVEWAEARRDYAKAGIAFLTPLLEEAEGILAVKAWEVEHQAPHKGARSRAEIAKGNQPKRPTPPAWLVNLGVVRNAK